MPLARGKVASLLVLAWLLAAGTARAGDSPYGKIVGDVIIKNNRVHPTENILSRMNTRPGRTLDAVTLTEDINNLLGTRWFAQGGVTVHAAVRDDGKVNVTVTVLELNGTVQEVIFKGNHHLRESDLESIANIRRGSPLVSPARIFALMDRPDLLLPAARSYITHLRMPAALTAMCNLRWRRRWRRCGKPNSPGPSRARTPTTPEH